MSKTDLIADIVSFLQNRITAGEVVEDEKESLELAIDCIRETFKVPEDTEARDLLAIYEKGRTAQSPAANSKSAGSTTKVEEAPVSPEDKAAADEKKANGNKLMAQRDFKGAADAYTEAIALNPSNPLFYSNRAAAFTHLSLHGRAVEDAKKATELDPSYSKAWSRLGLALWAQGDIKGSLDAYEAGLKAEGDSPSEAMKKDYENVLRRYKEETAKGDSLEKSSADESAQQQQSGAGTGGGFDFSQIASLMNNPQLKEQANKFASNPGALAELMNTPFAKNLMQSMGGGSMPDLSQMQDMMKKFQ